MVPIPLLETELPIPAVGFFVISFVAFLIPLIGLLMFGKGRPHSK